MNYVLVILVIFFTFPFQIYAADWAQDAGNAQRTGYTSEEPTEPWTYQWSFNGPDGNGGSGNHFYDAPKEARTITGGGKLYIPAGNKGLFGLTLSNGHQDWNITTASFIATPAYDASTQMIYAGASDGKVYKLNASTGSITGSYNTGSAIQKAVLLVGTSAYVVNSSGQLHKINTSTMQSEWVYTGNSRAATPPSYSASKNIIVFATDDLYVHGINNSDGSRKWRVKPSPNSPSGTSQQTVAGTFIGNQFDLGWPVIAEKHGVVFVRMQLSHQAHYEGPNSGKFANTNAENRTWLQANPQWKNLFALDLTTGAEKFIPAVGYGSTEDYNGSSTVGVMGSQPAIKILADGSEVAYMHFRNLQGNTSDYRWSGHMGEMILDDDITVSGLKAGDMRFINFPNSQVHIVDEQNPITVAGNYLLHNHWAAVEGAKITDRSPSKGVTNSDPIATSLLPRIMRATRACATFNATTHYASCIQYTTDGGSSLNGRSYSGAGFYSYWNIPDPPGWRVGSGNTAGSSYSSGVQPRYSYVSNGYIIVEGNGGDIIVLKHSGTSTTNPTTVPSTTPLSNSPTSATKLGDANGDNQVNGADYIIWLNHYGTNSNGSTNGDFNTDGSVNGVDYILWLNHYGT